MEIATDRLLIRPAVMSDVQAINNGIAESIDELRKYMPWANSIPTLEETRKNLADAIKMSEDKLDIRLLIFSRSGDFIGSSGLHKIDWRIPKAEIGYWIRTSKCGKGYATEAVKAIRDFAMQKLGFRRIEILISGSNKKSLGVVHRLEIPLEGILRWERVNPDGTVDDTHIYACIAEQGGQPDAFGAGYL